MRTIETIIEGIIAKEGRRYTEHPLDSGGPTKFGITLEAYSRFIGGPMRKDELAALTEPEALRFYMHEHVVKPGFVPILETSEAVGLELVDSSVLHGVWRAVEWMQRSLNALNRRQRDYIDVPVDGRCGRMTVAVLGAYLVKRRDDGGEEVLIRAMNCLQGEFMISLAERRQKDEEFVYGWLRERVE